MPALCLYFQVHQPFRLRHYTYFDIGTNPLYEDEESNRDICRRVADKCYLPANTVMLDLIERYGQGFRIAYSVSGVALDQFEQYCPEVLDSFRALADTGCVEFLNETYPHSLAFLHSEQEFREQVVAHRERVESLLGVTPTAFRNTELIYNNDLARVIEQMGYKAILTEGADHILGWRSPNFVYQPTACLKLKLLLKNYRLSDDVAFRFSNPEWEDYPLTAGKFAHWVHQTNAAGEVVNLFMDYETFGEHQWEETGIFQFLQAMPEAVLTHEDFRFLTPSEVADTYPPEAKLDVPHSISWADVERDLTAWLGNDMQQDAMRAVYDLEEAVRESGDADLLKTWRRLQTSDHFYYMCTKWFADGDVHKYFNPYSSPYDAYINYMNVIADLTKRLEWAAARQPAPTPAAS